MNRFKVAAVFSSHMVLQREKNITVFGEGTDGEKVIIEFNHKKYITTIHDNKWMVLLPPMQAGSGYTMTISCNGEYKIFDDIAIGEVWLAGGQSNMEFELQNCVTGKEHLNNDMNPDVRFYYTQKRSYMDDEFFYEEEQTSWSLFDAQSAKTWSAVGYLYAKHLAEELECTVGIIGCNWGGTSASAWMDINSLMEDRELTSYVDDYNKAIAGKTKEEQIKEYKEYQIYQEEFDKKVGAYYADHPKAEWSEVLEAVGECRWPGPMGISNPYRPGGLYECMVKRILPYTLRGFIYYQGESDDHKPKLYYKLFSRLIRQWREDWEDSELPFLFVQLPMHRYKADPDYKNWCLIREAQMKVYQTVKNTGIAVCLDCGEFNEIHPKDKEAIAYRLAKQALYHVYHQAQEWESFGPVYQSFEYMTDRIVIKVKYADGALVTQGKVNGFEIAGEDGVFYPAEAKIIMKEIILTSDEVKEPKFARYCWTNYGEVTVFGDNHIPLAPFRTHEIDG